MASLEIAFFDVETTIPSKKGDKFELLEFAAVVIASEGFYETLSYSTLIKPPSLSLITPKSVACNGITQEECAYAPAFSDVADRIFGVLHGRVWAGHNIQRFDILRVRDAFERCNRPAPEPLGVIDTLPLLHSKFGTRAGNLKMSRLAEFCGLGDQRHRALEDCRMNIEVLKHCAAMLFLESNFSNIFLPPTDASAGATQTQSPAALMETSRHDATPQIEEPSTDTLADTLAALSIANGIQSKDILPEIQGDEPFEEGNAKERSPFQVQSFGNASKDTSLEIQGDDPSEKGNAGEELSSYNRKVHSFDEASPQAGVPSPYGRPSWPPAEKQTDALNQSQMGGSERLWKGPPEEERLRFSGNNERNNQVVSWLTQKDSSALPWRTPLQDFLDASPSSDAFISLENPNTPTGGTLRQGKQPTGRRLSGSSSRRGRDQETHISMQSIDQRHLEVFRIASEQPLPDEESSEANGDSSPENASRHKSAQSVDRLRKSAPLERFESLDESCFSFPVSPGVAQSLDWPKTQLFDWPLTPELHREPSRSCFPDLKKFVKRKPGKVKANGRHNQGYDASHQSAAGSGSGSGSRSRSEESPEGRLDGPGFAKGEKNGAGATSEHPDPSIRSSQTFPVSHGPITLSQTDYACRRVNKLLHSVHEHVTSPEPVYTDPFHPGPSLSVNERHVTPEYGDRVFQNPGSNPRAKMTLRRHSFNASQTVPLVENSMTLLRKSSDFGGSLCGLNLPPEQSPADVLEGPYLDTSSNDVTPAGNDVVFASDQRSPLRCGAPDLVPAFAPWEVDVSLLQCVEVARSKGPPQLYLHLEDQPLQIHEQHVRLRFSVGDLYAYDAIGRPTFSVLGEPSDELRVLMDGCDSLLRAELEARGIQAEWRPSIIRKEGEADAIRIRIGAVGYQQTAHFTTRFLRQKRATRGTERLPLGVVDPLIFRSFFPHGCVVDVVFTVETYNVEGFAGTRLVASQLTLL